MNFPIVRAFVFIFTLVFLSGAHGQTDTTFTYQGELRQGGELASGAHDMEFSLWDAPTDGNQVGSTNPLAGVPVNGGLFTAELDFGATAFNNAPRWLQISVEGVELSPRTFLSRTPYAIQTRGIFVDSDQSVGVGTISPQAKLHVDGEVALGFGQADMRIQEIDPADLRFASIIDFFGIGIGSNTGTNRQMMMVTDGFPANPIFTVASSIDAGANWNAHLVVKQDGKVGIAMPNPQSFGLNVHQGGVSASKSLFDSGSGLAGLNLVTTYVEGTYTPGLFWSTSNDSPFSPKAGIHLHQDDLGTSMYFGTSNNFGAGITNAGIVIDPSGKVGINTSTPDFSLHVEGDAGKPGGGSWSTASDVRLKRNVEDLDGALDSLLGLRGVKFEYINPHSIHELPGRQLGMIAQEVEAVFPEWVDEGPKGYKTLTFRGFEALTVEAIRELYSETKEELDAKNEVLRGLEERIEALEALVHQMTFQNPPR